MDLQSSYPGIKDYVLDRCDMSRTGTNILKYCWPRRWRISTYESGMEGPEGHTQAYFSLAATMFEKSEKRLSSPVPLCQANPWTAPSKIGSMTSRQPILGDFVEQHHIFAIPQVHHFRSGMRCHVPCCLSSWRSACLPRHVSRRYRDVKILRT